MGKEHELLEAARTGNYAIVDKLLNYRSKRSGPLASLRRGPSPNAQDGSGYSSLHHATLNGHKEIVRLLLDYEASPNITDAKGLAPLHLAAWSGNCDIVRLLLQYRPRITNVNQLTREKESALHYASQYGHQEVVELLLEHDCDPTLKNNRNETALDLASQYGRFETVQILLYKKPELIKAMRKPTQHIILVHSPLHLASRSGHKDIVELLLNSGFYINLKTRAGTALHEAALCGKLDVVRTLLDHRIDLSITSDKGKTVLDLLQQFPTQISYDVMRLIESYRNNDENSLPHIPIQEHRSDSPYDNVRQNCDHNKFTINSLDSTPFKWDLTDDDFHENFQISTKSIGSDLSLYQMKQTQDDYLICNNMANSNNPGIELDQISYSSTNSSSCFSRDFNQRKSEFNSGPISYSGHSPNSLNIKLSPTESKKPHRRNLSISPSRPSNTAILSSSTKSNEIETNSSSTSSSYRLRHVHSMDQYVNIANKKDYLNCISTMPLKRHDYVLQRGKSEELFERKYRQCQLEPIAITEIYDDTCIKKSNPKRRLKRNKQISKNRQHDELIDNSSNSDNIKTVICLPPTVQQAENLIFQTIQLLNQQLNKKDAETEIEKCYIHSKQYENNSLSSNFSDKSNHKIEKLSNKNPFSGLLKGSSPEVNSKHYCNQIPDKSTNLHNNCDTEKAINGADGNDPLFDEQEEWNQIESIMESFGTGFIHESLLVDELEKEFQNRLMGISLTKKLNDHCISTPTTIKVPPPTIGKWLKSIGFENWEMKFITNGFDDVEFINGVLDEDDLRDLGIRNESDIKLIIKAIDQLPNKIKEVKLFYKEFNQRNNNNEIDNNSTIIDQWLNSIHLEQYYETFRNHLYIDFEKIQRIWDIELSTILEIEKTGHRKRILISVGDDTRLQYRPKLEDINNDLKTLKTNIQQLKQDLDKNEQKIKHKSKKSRPAPPPPISISKEKCNNELLTIRDPEELLIGKKSNKNKITEWKHEPIILVTGSIAYIANYLGSTIVHELKGMDSTKQSIEKLKRSESNPKPTPEVILSISVRGVQFLNTITQELICEHDIKNIHCVCQDNEDLTHFAYITKDLDSEKHYCHVFSMKTTQDAAEVILTLGEAFEVAYQMKLKDENQMNNKTESTNFADKQQLLSQSVVLENNSDNLINNWNRPRSYSENEIKIAQKF